jgi:hypothetical protein
MKAFKNIGHFFATLFKGAVSAIPKIEATASAVETVTNLVPVYGPLAATVEQAAYACLGELASVLTAGSAAAEAKLADAGLDANVVATVKALVAGIPTIVADAKKL